MIAKSKGVLIDAFSSDYKFDGKDGKAITGTSYKIVFIDPDGFSTSTRYKEFFIEELLFKSLSLDSEDVKQASIGKKFDFTFKILPKYSEGKRTLDKLEIIEIQESKK